MLTNGAIVFVHEVPTLLTNYLFVILILVLFGQHNIVFSELSGGGGFRSLWFYWNYRFSRVCWDLQVPRYSRDPRTYWFSSKSAFSWVHRFQGNRYYRSLAVPWFMVLRLARWHRYYRSLSTQGTLGTTGLKAKQVGGLRRLLVLRVILELMVNRFTGSQGACRSTVHKGSALLVLQVPVAARHCSVHRFRKDKSVQPVPRYNGQQVPWQSWSTWTQGDIGTTGTQGHWVPRTIR